MAFWASRRRSPSSGIAGDAEDAHRFEPERRALYVRLLEAVTEAEKTIRSRRVAASVKRERPDLDPEMPDRPDLDAVNVLTDEIEILAPFRVLSRCHRSRERLLLLRLDYAVGEEDEEWNRVLGPTDLGPRRRVLEAAEPRTASGRPPGVMTTWQNRRYPGAEAATDSRQKKTFLLRVTVYSSVRYRLALLGEHGSRPDVAADHRLATVPRSSA